MNGRERIRKVLNNENIDFAPWYIGLSNDLEFERLLKEKGYSSYLDFKREINDDGYQIYHDLNKYLDFREKRHIITTFSNIKDTKAVIVFVERSFRFDSLVDYLNFVGAKIDVLIMPLKNKSDEEILKIIKLLDGYNIFLVNTDDVSENENIKAYYTKNNFGNKICFGGLLGDREIFELRADKKRIITFNEKYMRKNVDYEKLFERINEIYIT